MRPFGFAIVIGALSVAVSIGAGGCVGHGGAVNARWRIVERATGDFHDPGNIADDNGVCCQPVAGESACAGAPAWRIPRVRIVVANASTGEELAGFTDPGAGLDAPCGTRELTTPFELPDGLFAMNLIAYDPATPTARSAVSPSPELRTVHRAEIVNLDIIALSVPVQ